MKYHSGVQTIGWFRDRYREGSLQIKPPYQRKPVWAERQKTWLVESVLMGLPIPEVFIQTVTEAEGATTYAVVDGQQRIRTLLQFVGAEFDPDQAAENKFSLDKLPTTSEWRGVSFDDLTDEQKVALFGYKLAVRELDTGDESDIRGMFARLNKFLTPLKPQELRNANYCGPFIQLANRLADDAYWAENRIITPAAIRRMGDIQFVSELLIGTLHGPQGGSPRFIDEYYAQYEDYEDEFPGERQATRLYESALRLVKEVLPDIRDTRWSNVTDFYSLFVALAFRLRNGKLRDGVCVTMRHALDVLAGEVETKIGDSGASVTPGATRYARAAEKGVNDKARRAERHQVLAALLAPFFE